ncbi:GNAT family N-acetyltransferase [Pseudoalteromonas shioyasakiensis]|uniref:GNAT family N-acetyltransferase n=1 Tax=Pseudoalteromonas shioyasakiensis TaxID=1190813 RepID=UPI002551DD02|nr:GNAT family N-acetyltransferase [Pseudoalteromonas shioyasakiensis]MDK9685416.1 GNAT family N-acetyltransferase [Pseudoalteromonas shioyasakiensis]
MQDFKPYNEYLTALCNELVIAKHRQLVIVQGSETWCYQFANQLALKNTYVFSSSSLLANSEFPKHAHQILGQEFQHAIFDGFSGLYADKLAALAGTVKAGGVLILLLPDDRKWQDPALTSITSYGQVIKHSFFNQRLFSKLKLQPHYFTEHSLPAYQSVSPATAEINHQQQQACVEQIIKTATGRANRPFVISADRGRGKSAALGLAAANLQGKKILICATQVKAVQTSFKHLAAELGVSKEQNFKQLANLSYIAPDTLLNEKPDCDLLFVDEAAAIPVPMLLQILKSYPRIVFASTMVGYEGNGRGYTLRFLHYLRSQYKSLKAVTLDEPIRFAKHDPLENSLRELLLLDAKYLDTQSGKSYQFENISKDQLVEDEQLLSQIMALLALAHYQTTVNDLRQLLDAPELQLSICKQENTLKAVCLIAIEGGLAPEIAEQVIKGKRRPHGHLMAQTLTQLSRNTEDLCKRSARVVRIAVAPECHQQGIGSALLNYCESQLNNCSYFGASFGANAALVKFWQSNGFNIVKLGFSHDKATAEHAALVIKALDKQSTDSAALLIEEFKQDLSLQLLGHFSSLPWQLIAELFKRLPKSDLSSALNTRAERLLTGDINIFQVQPLLWKMIWSTPISLNLLDEHTKFILIRLVLQQTSVNSLIEEAGFTGKKDLDSQFKTAVQGWYAHYKSLQNNSY